MTGTDIATGTQSGGAALAPARSGSVDALVVGGGPAGLSAALILGRALRTVVIADADSSGVHARSTWPQVNRNLLGWPDGLPAARLRELGRQQIEAYPGVTWLEQGVQRIRAVPGGVLRRGGGGQRDRPGCAARNRSRGPLPRVPRLGRLCRPEPALVSRLRRLRGPRHPYVLGSGTTAALDALQLHRFSADVTLLTDTGQELGPQLFDSLRAAGVAVIAGDVASVEGDKGYLTALLTTQGDRLPCDHLFSILPASPRSRLGMGLGAQTSADGFVSVDTEQHTTTPGVYAAGDITRVHSHQIATALHEGTQAGHAMSHALLPGDLQ